MCGYKYQSTSTEVKAIKHCFFFNSAECNFRLFPRLKLVTVARKKVNPALNNDNDHQFPGI